MSRVTKLQKLYRAENRVRRARRTRRLERLVRRLARGMMGAICTPARPWFSLREAPVVCPDWELPPAEVYAGLGLDLASGPDRQIAFLAGLPVPLTAADVRAGQLRLAESAAVVLGPALERVAQEYLGEVNARIREVAERLEVEYVRESLAPRPPAGLEAGGELDEERPEPKPVGRCPRCGAPWYTLEAGFCGGCR